MARGSEFIRITFNGERPSVVPAIIVRLPQIFEGTKLVNKADLKNNKPLTGIISKSK